MLKKTKPTISKKVFLGAVGSVMLYIPIQQSFAQLEEIVVTSRRYEERITDAPLAVAVMDADYLKNNRVDSVSDILELTPGADWGQFAKAQPRLSLRGITGGSFGNASLEHAVSVVNDGIPMTKAFMMTLPTYDLQRVEVLRGPQGTTFGRNATLGMLHFVSARPNQETSGGVEFSAGELNLFGVNGHYNTALSDTLSGRIAFNYQDTDGSLEDEATGDTLEFAENTSVRASLFYEPSDTFNAYFKIEKIEDEEFPTVRRGVDLGATFLTPRFGSVVSSTDPWVASVSPAPEGNPWIVERDIFIASGELSWDIGNGISVTSITGYQDGEHFSNSDAFGTPFDIRDQLVTNDATVLSQEIRIDNHGSGNKFRWLAGVSYVADEEDRFERNVGFPARGNCEAINPDNCPTFVLDQIARNETDAYGIFGELTYDFTDQLTLAVGGRYSNDTRDYDYAIWGFGSVAGLGGVGLGAANPLQDCSAITASGATPGQCGTADNPVGFAGDIEETFTDFSPKVSLSYALNDNNNIYALYSEGFKAGGFQQDARALNNLEFVVGSEDATNYELGWKGSYENLVFALTLFKQEQTDVQVTALVALEAGNASLLVNADGIENTGFELETTWAATENLTIGGSLALYDPKFINGSRIAATFDPVTGDFSGGEDVSGAIPQNSVDEALTIYANYGWELANGSRFDIRADLRHRGEVVGLDGERNRTGQNLNGDGLAFERPELNKIGLNIGWTSADENLNISLWGRNLDDDPDYTNYGPPFGFLYSRAADGTVARGAGFTGRRQVGATVRYNFGG